jgi:dTDP-4-dehydrorhamnose reductase
MSILVLGSTGYLGSAYIKNLQAAGLPHHGLSRRELDYSRPEVFIPYLKDLKPSFVLNAAGYTGKPNVDACETDKTRTLEGNAILPGMLREACEAVGIPWGHVSSGCIYTGRRPDGGPFREEDAPNFCFRTNNCSFYSGTKALGEEVLTGAKDCYIWRLRIPFDNEDSPRNYLKKLMTYKQLLEAENSISHLGEFVQATLDTWLKKLPFGIYNVTNPGFVTTSRVTELIIEEGQRRKAAGEPNPFPEQFDFFTSEDEFMKIAAKTPRSNCVLDTTKLTQAGIELTPVEDAIRASLRTWGT